MPSERTRSPDLEVLLDRYTATFATKDVRAITELHAADGTFWLHLDEQPVRGRAAIGRRFGAVFDLWPGLTFVSHRRLFGDRFWVLEWTLLLPGAALSDPSGTTALDALDVVVVDAHGLVARKDTYLDAGQLSALLSGRHHPVRTTGAARS